jgi:hypothetical protein
VWGGGGSVGIHWQVVTLYQQLYEYGGYQHAQGCPHRHGRGGAGVLVLHRRGHQIGDGASGRGRHPLAGEGGGGLQIPARWRGEVRYRYFSPILLRVKFGRFVNIGRINFADIKSEDCLVYFFVGLLISRQYLGVKFVTYNIKILPT